jgi:molybdate transport system substrate-binding protein
MSVPISVVSSMATQAVLAELVRAFEARSTRQVALESIGGVKAAERVRAGEAFDVVVLASDAIDKLCAAGHLVPSSKVDLAHSGVAVAVRAGKPRPEIGSEAALQRSVRAAESIGHSTGPSGVKLVALLERWGIHREVRERIRVAPPGVPVGTLVARGEVELGFQQLSELIHIEGIDVLGPMPAGTEIITTFSAALGSGSIQPAAGRELLLFLASPEAAGAKQRQGMQPT